MDHASASITYKQTNKRFGWAGVKRVQGPIAKRKSGFVTIIEQPFFHSRQHFTEAFTAERLEDVIQSFQLECRYRMAVIRGRKDHLRIVFDRFQNLQSAQARHSHIQKY